jgi:hypothetical protein
MCTLTANNCATHTTQATLTIDSVSSVQGLASAKDLFLQNNPNPVNTFTTIEYTLPEPGGITLEILDLCGHVISQPVMEVQASGRHSIVYDASALQPGLYFYCLKFKSETRNFSTSRKMIKIN